MLLVAHIIVWYNYFILVYILTCYKTFSFLTESKEFLSLLIREQSLIDVQSGKVVDVRDLKFNKDTPPPEILNHNIFYRLVYLPARILEEYMKDIQGKGGSLPSSGPVRPVRQDEPVS